MGDVTSTQARHAWDRLASRYDPMMRLMDRLQFSGGREWVCSRARGDVLEIALGTGLNLPLYSSAVRLTGVDISSGMLAVARRRAAELGRPVNVSQADAGSLPFSDACFDTVVCTLSLCAVPDERTVLQEAWRVLRPGGRLLLLDHVGSHHRPIWAVQRLLELLSSRMGESQTRRPLPVVRDLGFVVEESQRLKAGTVERVAAVKPPV